jgi:MSHA type pilus biogenesis protein MshL
MQVSTDMTRFAYSLMAKRFFMKLSSQLGSQVTSLLALFLVSFTFFACTPTNDSEKATAEAIKPEAVAAMPVTRDMTPPSLPVQYQKPAYTIDSPSKDELTSQADDAVLKVGARINSTKKVALREIMKPLASQKKLNISWSSDVNQDALVDVDIKADDDFYKAIDNILRQVDYFYELQGSTIVIKYRETKQFHIAMPFIKQAFSTGTGGNVLGGDVGGEGIAKNIEGTIKLISEKNEFDIWSNVRSNMESILKVEHTKKITSLKNQSAPESTGKNPSTSNKPKDSTKESAPNVMSEEVEVTGGAENYYMIDKPIGLITVTAPRPIIEKVAAYFTSLQKEIYKQVSIEAKIIEVQLLDSSSIGINWDSVLKNFSVTGAIGFGSQTSANSTSTTASGATAGTALNTLVNTINTQTNADGSVTTTTTNNTNPNNSTSNNSSNTNASNTALMAVGQVWPDVSKLVSSVRINTSDFGVFLNALKTQGNTKVLSNPKISVLNGQPAMISVGKNITYVDKITVTKGTADSPGDTFAPETASVLSGVGLGLTATILDNNEIILNLIPITSELVGDVVQYKTFADGSSVGLPVVNIREMSTTVRVKDGDMLVIGGLISDMNDQTGNFAPVLGEIPLVKYLFGHEEKVKNKRELIILLKPRII